MAIFFSKGTIFLLRIKLHAMCIFFSLHSLISSSFCVMTFQKLQASLSLLVDHYKSMHHIPRSLYPIHHMHFMHYTPHAPHERRYTLEMYSFTPMGERTLLFITFEGRAMGLCPYGPTSLLVVKFGP
jgi:hypothetical protein